LSIRYGSDALGAVTALTESSLAPESGLKRWVRWRRFASYAVEVAMLGLA